ncbi:MAG TPA: hypothetical protein PKL81_12235, partial [Ferruginibacter sp.]|nr:hypothetical protein [Ferruginibacter sp.]
MKRFFQAVLLVLFAVSPAKAQQATTPGLVNNNTATTKQAAVAHLSVASLLAMDTDQAGPDYNLYKKRARTHRTI